MLKEMEQVRIGQIDYRNPRVPIFPRTAIEILRMQEEGSNDLRELAGIISGDPTSAQLLLRRANSAYYGVRRKVGDVSHAVSLLGFGPSSDLVLSLAMLRLGEVFPDRAARAVFQRITRVSLATAWSARLLADLVRECVERAPSVVSTFSVGLLHATGRTVLLYNETERYVGLACADDPIQALLAPPRRKYAMAPGAGSEPPAVRRLPEIALERRAFDTDHEVLGGIVCALWGLPSRYSRVLSPYDDEAAFEQETDRLLTCVVKAATVLAEAMTWDEDETRPAGPVLPLEPEMPEELPVEVVRVARMCGMEPLDLLSIMITWEDEVRLFVEHILTP